jgi:hypothetical protein
VGSVDHESIVLYSLAFMDRYIRGSAAASLLTRPNRDVASLRYAAERRE